ncbi:phosphoribosyl-dephospho-CoA transferase [Sideroxyarcus emersonii]|uniref:Phosphoribosyl-dephospho-CoA transferase n=1 Tax=Sideroxyarcus emersonii TaxID=2764705 RepID=A0AAN1XBJ8_9PROT|nr:malonate decarboxylase holo-[acyl-carrier-protein] synthase [Sideroxyarcus emersonii]BCK88466.1 phosphoribosyl-dephospho-CoA transferase [Sideroxyarcus emersonii]
MNTLRLRRHDLVWLDPAIDVGRFAAAAQADATRHWVKQGFPLVVARQTAAPGEGAERIKLGFTLPSAPARTRVMLSADRPAIIRHSRPLLLADAMHLAPTDWQANMNKLHALFERTGTVARVYGSLSSEILTGRRYLDASSDLDLLLECGDATRLRELLTGLEVFSPAVPRIDGEILATSGWAAAWRELAAAMRNGIAQVLAKSDTDVQLIGVEEFTQPFPVPA